MLLNYHPSKANVVADGLSRKGKTMMNDMEIKEQESIVELKKMGLRLSVGPKGSLLAQLKKMGLIFESAATQFSLMISKSIWAVCTVKSMRHP